MSYGNVLSVFHADEQIIACVETELNKLKTASFHRIESTFFVETKDRDETRELLDQLNKHGVAYSLVHITVKSGAAVKSNQISTESHRLITQLILS